MEITRVQLNISTLNSKDIDAVIEDYKSKKYHLDSIDINEIHKPLGSYFKAELVFVTHDSLESLYNEK